MVSGSQPRACGLEQVVQLYRSGGVGPRETIASAQPNMPLSGAPNGWTIALPDDSLDTSACHAFLRCLAVSVGAPKDELSE